MSAELYNLETARSPEQRAKMQDLTARGECIFCPEHAAGILHRGEHWYVKPNDFPYAGALAHYLIVPLRHVESFDELPDEAAVELWAFKRRLKAEHDPIATATVERSGNMHFNGGSVAHLHVHFVLLDEAPSETVRFRVSAHAR